MRLSPVLTAQGTYPFVRIEQQKRDAAASGVEILDFGQGDPQEPTDQLIRDALVAGLRERMSYPKAEGLPELREAVTGWVERRFGVALDPASEVVPTYGSKEAIFGFAQVAVDRNGERNLVAVTDPGYPVPARGAEYAGAEVIRVPLREEQAFLPDLDAIDEDTWRRLAVFWVNYPNNPTGALAPPAFYERLSALAVEHDFLLCSDEAYTELWFGEQPGSALQVRDRSNVVVFQTLSKRSSMTGYRSGFVAASSEVIAALKTYRPTVGTAPQEFVQRASVAAWDDEEHVERTRDVYRRKRTTLVDVLERRGWRIAGGDATMYLWVAIPNAERSEDVAARLLEHGIVVAPGAYLGQFGEGFIRLALVPNEVQCSRAAAILEEIL